MAALSTSPTSVSFLAAYDTAWEAPADADAKKPTPLEEESGAITLKEFVDALPPLIRRQKEEAGKSPDEASRQGDARGTNDDPVHVLFSRIDLTAGEWKKYALFDSQKNYTRNLIATDNETFTLLLLCWNAGKESPIHDHPCDGCWLRVCEGKVRETRYKMNGVTDKMDVTYDEVYEDDAPAFIKDSMGYHKVGNPSKTVPAVTLHLYCPPFDQCRIWLDKNHASRPSKACMCNYSEYSVKHTCEMFEVISI
ncbi:hypothetical protein ACHAXT_002973 [Thalassiosira profunda]